MNINLANIPDALRMFPHWILWRNETRDHKPTKVPYTTSGGFAKSNDPTTWSAFGVAEGALTAKYSGLGFVFKEGGGLAGVDLDGCRDPESGEIAPWATAILGKLNSYSEVSPSGTGVKVFVKGELTTAGKKKELGFLGVYGKAPAIEVYDRGRYFAVTGDHLPGTPNEVCARQASIDSIVAEYWPAEPRREVDFLSSTAAIERARAYMAKYPPAIAGQGGHNHTFRAACVLVKGFELSEAEAFSVLAEWNQVCQPKWSDKELSHKINGALKASGETGYLRNVKPDRWEEIKVPAAVAPRAVAAAPKVESVKLTTFAESMGEFIDEIVSGAPNTISTGIPDLDDALGGGIAAGEMVVITGRPSHGKTMLALQIIHEVSKEGRRCLLVSEETPARIVGERALMYTADVERDEWELRVKELKKFAELYKVCHADNLIAENCRNIDATVGLVRDCVRDKGIGLAAVDYLQLLEGKGNGRYEKVTNVSMQLRQCANELNIPILVLCQLNRDVEDRDKFIPRNSDIRDSGQIEQDAAVIIHCMWPKLLDDTKPKNEYWLSIGKNKNRGIRKQAVKFTFEPARMRIKPEFVDRPNYVDSFSNY
jgi:hypothetical protein